MLDAQMHSGEQVVVDRKSSNCPPVLPCASARLVVAPPASRCGPKAQFPPDIPSIPTGRPRDHGMTRREPPDRAREVGLARATSQPLGDRNRDAVGPAIA